MNHAGLSFSVGGMRKGVLRLALAFFFAAGCALVPRASAQGVGVQCNVYDAVSGQPITTAAPGTKVLVAVTVTLPPGAGDARIDVELSAKLKIGNIALPFNVPITPASAPNVDPKTGTALVTTGTQQKVFTIPTKTPVGSTVKLTATASVLGLSSGRAVSVFSVQ